MSTTDVKREHDKRFRSKLSRKHWRDYRLRELEKQLEFAESRCGTLKQQLDYIKVLYGCGRPTTQEAEEISKSYDKVKNSDITTAIRRISCDDLSRWNKLTENYGGENHEKCLQPETVSCTNTTRGSSNSSNKPISSKSSFEKKDVINIDFNEPIEQRSRVRLAKGKRRKNSNSKHKVKGKGTKPRFNHVICQTPWPAWQDPVVEIYKNTAANIESESAADVTYKNKRPKLDNLQNEQSKTNVIYGVSGISKKLNESSEQLIPATKLKAFTSFKSLEKVPTVKEESVQTECQLEIEYNCSHRNERSASADTLSKSLTNTGKLDNMHHQPEPLKSYCQPTISSKKKRVERTFLSSLNNLNLKNIPFIAATSTAPSHNIGVNIQQVLSIMKKRQPQPNTPGDIIPILSDQSIGNNTGQHQSNCRVTVSEGTDGSINNCECGVELTLSESKKRLDAPKSAVSEKKLSDKGPFKLIANDDVSDNIENPDWMSKVHKLKKVLVFLHEDFTTLSQKYKKLQKKLSKRNINKLDAKGELAEIERDLEKKEEEITIVIGLYKEVLNLRDEVKKYQERYNLIICERALMMDGIKQSNSTHTQMSTLLRKIQQFQDKLKR